MAQHTKWNFRFVASPVVKVLMKLVIVNSISFARWRYFTAKKTICLFFVRSFLSCAQLVCKMKKRTQTSQPDQILRVCTYFNHYNLFGFIFSAISTCGIKKKKKKKQKKYGVNYAVRKQTKDKKQQIFCRLEIRSIWRRRRSAKSQCRCVNFELQINMKIVTSKFKASSKTF